MMKSTLFAGAVVAASLGLAGLAQAQTAHPKATYPTSPYERAVPSIPDQFDSATTQEEAHCTPLGVPPNGIGALPASNHPCP
jgi:hypothetical protein